MEFVAGLIIGAIGGGIAGMAIMLGLVYLAAWVSEVLHRAGERWTG